MASKASEVLDDWRRNVRRLPIPDVRPAFLVFVGRTARNGPSVPQRVDPNGEWQSDRDSAHREMSDQVSVASTFVLLP